MEDEDEEVELRRSPKLEARERERDDFLEERVRMGVRRFGI